MSIQQTLDGTETDDTTDTQTARVGVAYYLDQYDSVAEARRHRAADALGVEPDRLDDLAAADPADAAREIAEIAPDDDARETALDWLEHLDRREA